MGDTADAMLSGLFCTRCGEVFDDMEEPGYPRICYACGDQEDDYPDVVSGRDEYGSLDE